MALWCPLLTQRLPAPTVKQHRRETLSFQSLFLECRRRCLGTSGKLAVKLFLLCIKEDFCQPFFSQTSFESPGCFICCLKAKSFRSHTRTVFYLFFANMSFFFYLYPGGNEESELCELQTAREWSDDEDGGDPDEDDGLASSPSIWGTPRQNSFELTFSYIAIAEAAGAARQHRDRRSRVSSRGGRVSVVDAPEKLLDSPDVEWDPNAFLTREEEEVSGEYKDNETITIQPSPQSLAPDSQMDAGTQREEVVSGKTFQPPPPPPSSQHQSPSHTPPGKRKQEYVKWLFSITEVPKMGQLIHHKPVKQLTESKDVA